MMRLNDVLQSGTSFSGRRRSRSPSPVGIGVRSRSMDGRMPKITVDRTPSDESLASSCAQMSMTSPGSHSSSSPRSPISPPWSSNGSSSGSGGNGGGARSPSKFRTLYLTILTTKFTGQIDYNIYRSNLQVKFIYSEKATKFCEIFT